MRNSIYTKVLLEAKIIVCGLTVGSCDLLTLQWRSEKSKSFRQLYISLKEIISDNLFSHSKDKIVNFAYFRVAVGDAE